MSMQVIADPRPWMSLLPILTDGLKEQTISNFTVSTVHSANCIILGHYSTYWAYCFILPSQEVFGIVVSLISPTGFAS